MSSLTFTSQTSVTRCTCTCEHRYVPGCFFRVEFASASILANVIGAWRFYTTQVGIYNKCIPWLYHICISYLLRTLFAVFMWYRRHFLAIWKCVIWYSIQSADERPEKKKGVINDNWACELRTTEYTAVLKEPNRDRTTVSPLCRLPLVLALRGPTHLAPHTYCTMIMLLV